MTTTDLSELLRGIIYRALPSAAALGVGAILLACECPITTSEQVTMVQVRGAQAKAVEALADAKGALPASECASLCGANSWEKPKSCAIASSGAAPNANATTHADTGQDAGVPPTPDTETAGETADPDAETQEPELTLNISCVVEVTTDCGGVGRRIAGTIALGDEATGSAVGRYYADAACIEAGAAKAFDILATDLDRLGAPARLICEARHAAVQERRHTDMVARIAVRYGGSPRRAHVTTRPGRSLQAICIENAAEGLVEETYGALVAHWQANAAADAEIRSTMAEIANDETAHAAWSWRLHQWALPRLSENGRHQVERALHNAIADLEAKVQKPRDAELVNQAGLPTPAVAEQLLGELRTTVFSS